MNYIPANVDNTFFQINIFPLQAQYFTRTHCMEGLNRNKTSLFHLFYLGYLPQDIQHFLSCQGFPFCFYIACQTNFFALDRIQADKPILHRHIQYYQISPYELVYTDDNYYLVGFEKKRRTYRIDRMANVEVIPELREGSETFADLRKDKLRLQKSTFSMFDGRIETVTMVFRKNLMNAVMDRFGSDVFVSPVDKEHFQISVPVAVSQQFYGWVFGLGNYVTIIGPEHIKKELARKLEDIRKRYD